MAFKNKYPLHEVKDKFARFLETFRAEDDDQDAITRVSDFAASQEDPTYVKLIKHMDTSEGTTLYVDYNHLVEDDLHFAEAIRRNLLEYEPTLRQAVALMVAKFAPEKLETSDRKPREFFCSFWNVTEGLSTMRDLKTHYIGRLSAFVGTVTRTSEVRPELFLGSFKCMGCQTIKRNVPQQFRYTEPLICGSPACGNTSSWQLVKEESVFVDWQKACVQEATSEVPSGCLPRTMDVVLRHDMCEKVRPGDKVVFTGALIVVPDVAAYNAPGEKVVAKKGRTGGGARAPGTVVGTADGGVSGVRGVGVKELNYRLAFLACSVQQVEEGSSAVNIRAEETEEDVLLSLTQRQLEELNGMVEDPQIYTNLARSLAPGVFGHEDVKRAILLMLFGGVHKTTQDGTQLRGDINVAIVGDPSCGKSQMLKYVSTFMPRAVYTSGKSSSAAGLTATVARDNDTNEYCIEAGALMLADNGICCIDEFDKMDAKDQVAIHEAMEQQTISITKAGIQATLNARTSILAAANPIGGRYDKSKPLRANVTLTPAILSRFDLLHIMVDEPDDVNDFQIATHIVNVHRDGPKAVDVPYTMQQMQRFIKYARTFKPRITAEAGKVLVESYKRLRADDAAPGSNTSYRITVRQLEALIRLSQALARVRCSRQVTPAHVREAARLLKNSILSVESPDVALEAEEEDVMEEEAAIQEAREGLLQRFGQQLPAENADQQGAEAMQEDERTDAGMIASNQPQDAQAQQNPGADAGPTAPPKTVQVSQRKFNMIKNLLVMKLREVEETRDAANEGDALVLEGLQQKELCEWYFQHQFQRGAFKSEADMLDELVLLEKIVQRLIKKDHVLTVVEEPQRKEGETGQDYLRRTMSERVIGINPNFVQE